MAGTNSLADFLTNVGFAIDEGSYNALLDRIKNLKAQLKGIGGAVTTSGTAVQKQQLSFQERIDLLKAKSQDRELAHANRLELVNRRAQIQAENRAARAAAGQSGGGLFGMARGLVGSAIVAGIAFETIGKPLFEAATLANRLQSSFTALSGSAQETARWMTFLRSETDRLGLNFETASQGLIRLEASAKDTGMAQKDVQALFTGLSEYSQVIGLDPMHTDRAFRAVGQMMSTNIINARELRQELAMDMPGSMTIFAKALGIPVQKLEEMSKAGELIAVKDLPAFARALKQAAEASGGLELALLGPQAAMNRLRNAWTYFLMDINKAGGNKAIVDILNFLAKALKAVGDVIVTWVGPAIKTISIIFSDFTDIATALFSILKTSPLTFLAIASAVLIMTGTFQAALLRLVPLIKALAILDAFETATDPKRKTILSETAKKGGFFGTAAQVGSAGLQETYAAFLDVGGDIFRSKALKEKAAKIEQSMRDVQAKNLAGPGIMLTPDQPGRYTPEQLAKLQAATPNVEVNVTVTQANATPDQISDATKKAVDSALSTHFTNVIANYPARQ